MAFSRIKKQLVEFFYPFRIRRIAKECGDNLYVGGPSSVTRNTVLKEHVHFNGMSISGGGNVTIGRYFHSGTGCQIITSFHNYEGDAIPYDDEMINKDVLIGDFVWLGNNVIVLGGSTIGEGAIIQAGSIVCNDIPAYSIAGGHPAKPFKYRDIEHFNKMKKENRFH